MSDLPIHKFEPPVGWNGRLSINPASFSEETANDAPTFAYVRIEYCPSHKCGHLISAVEEISGITDGYKALNMAIERQYYYFCQHCMRRWTITRFVQEVVMYSPRDGQGPFCPWPAAQEILSPEQGIDSVFYEGPEGS